MKTLLLASILFISFQSLALANGEYQGKYQDLYTKNQNLLDFFTNNEVIDSKVCPLRTEFVDTLNVFTRESFEYLENLQGQEQENFKKFRNSLIGTALRASRYLNLSCDDSYEDDILADQVRVDVNNSLLRVKFILLNQ